jgi:hypothetical protein
VNTGAAVLFACAGFFCLCSLTAPRIEPDGQLSSTPVGYALFAAVFLFCGLVAA